MREKKIAGLWWAILLAAGASAQEAPPATEAPTAVATAVQEAAALLRSGDPEAARDILLEVIASTPRHGGARVLLGRIALERGEATAARRHLEIAVAAAPPRPYLAWHLLARAQLLLGEAEAARESWNHSLELAPRFGPALLGRALASLRLADVEPAVADLELAVGLDRAGPETRLLLAEVYLLEGRSAEAMTLLVPLTKDRRAAVDRQLEARLLALSFGPQRDLLSIGSILGRNLHLTRGLVALGIAHLEGGDEAAATQALRAALDADDPDPVAWLLLNRIPGAEPTPFPEPFADLPARLLAARRLQETGDAEAGAKLTAILERRPHNVPARMLLVLDAERRQDRWTALAGYRRLVEQLPGLSTLEESAARAARAMGALDLAACLADRAVAERPQDAMLHYLRAAIQADTGHYEAARDSCRQAIQLGLEEAAVYVTLGFVEFEQMNVATSIAAYARALELDPHSTRRIPQFALASLTTESYGALGDLLRAHVARNPEDREALYTFGVMSLRDNELAIAREILERLDALAPEDPRVPYNLASIYLRQGDRERSAAAMERFRALKAIEDQRWLEHNRAHALRLEAGAALERGEPAAAIAIYERLAAAGTADLEDYLTAGRSLLAIDDPLRAYGWFEQLLAATPYHQEALKGLAAAAERLGRTEVATQARERAKLLAWSCEDRPASARGTTPE